MNLLLLLESLSSRDADSGRSTKGGLRSTNGANSVQALAYSRTIDGYISAKMVWNSPRRYLASCSEWWDSI